MKPCPHLEHVSPGQARLCTAVRAARELTRAWSSDPARKALLAALVEAHEAERADEAARLRAADTLERATLAVRAA